MCSVAQSRPTLFDPMDYIAHQAPLSTEFSRQEYWSELPFPSPGDHPDPGIEPGSPALEADSLPTELPGGGSTKQNVTDNKFAVDLAHTL